MNAPHSSCFSGCGGVFERLGVVWEENCFVSGCLYSSAVFSIIFPPCSPGVDEQLKMVKMNRGNERFVNDERVNEFSHGLPWKGRGKLLSFMLVFICDLLFIFAG